MIKRLTLITFSLMLAACTQQPAQTTQAELEWRPTQTGTADYDMPIMKLELVHKHNGEMIYVRECMGTATMESIEGTTDPAVLCWWAGGGERYVAEQNGNLVTVKSQQVDEESGYGKWVHVTTFEF